ncbi:hypothetical protein [Frateuria defendens]|nr:hypothetical protein [Frateuria defendens]
MGISKNPEKKKSLSPKGLVTNGETAQASSIDGDHQQEISVN